jgi:hypothetical protein
MSKRINAWHTPVSIPESTQCRALFIPDSVEWLAIVSGALSELTLPYRWEQVGAVTALEAAERMTAMLEQYYKVGCGGAAEQGAPTPFWDEDVDVDDELPSDAQPWYGTVPNPEADQAQLELDFVENFLIWTITGFLAVATWEIGAAPAILFSTVAPKFVLAMRRGEFGEVIRILVDGEEAARVDTTARAAGEVVRVPINADPGISAHNIAIVQVS